MLRAVNDSVVVLTGASSGIGYATARALARGGASLALAARAEPDLEATAAECRRLGADVLAVPTDVADERAVESLAQRAEERFGRLDVWINNAGVMAYGSFEQIPSEVFRRVVEITLMGQVHGARAALPRFRAQGGGTLINLSSTWGRVTTPWVSPYVIAKHAVRALSECLRHELDGAEEINVVTLVPQAVDTPIFEHAANYTGHEIRPIPPLNDPEDVAAGIVRCIESPRREVTYGRAGRALEALYALWPSMYCRIAPAMYSRGSLSRDRAEPTPGNVGDGRGGGRARGGWRDEKRRSARTGLVEALRGLGASLTGRGSRSVPKQRSTT